MRRPALLALAASLLMLASAGAEPAGARNGMKAIWGPVQLGALPQFPIYRDLGVNLHEAGLSWDATALRRPRHPRDPRDPAYRWPAATTAAVAAARSYGMRSLLLVSNSPAWANGGHASSYAPLRASDYGDFLVAAARHYPSVHLWMAWGEPSRRPNFRPLVPARPGRRLSAAQAAAPRRYARMLDAAYAGLKGVSARNLVIGGNTYTTGDISTPQWVRNMRLPDGRPPRMDLYGHNPFSLRRPNLAKPASPLDQYDFSDMGRLSSLVNAQLRRGPRRIRLFLSEWTIPTAANDSEFNYWATLPVQASWIRSAWRIVRSHSWIYGLGWIHVRDDAPGGSNGGLMFADGRRKPGYFAYKAG
jgi:hypothetical protein